MARLGLAAFLLAALFIVAVASQRPGQSLAEQLGKMYGQFTAAKMEEETEALAYRTREVKEAAAQVERLSLAYQKALEAEANIASRQIASINKTQWAKQLGSGIADAICGLVLAGQVLGPSADPLLAFCKLGDVARTAIVEDYAQALKGGRSPLAGGLLELFKTFGAAGQQ